jgi:hypothetical protein
VIKVIRPAFDLFEKEVCQGAINLTEIPSD